MLCIKYINQDYTTMHGQPITKISYQVVHNTEYKFSSYLRNGFKIDQVFRLFLAGR